MLRGNEAFFYFMIGVSSEDSCLAYFLKQRFNDVDVGGIFFNEIDEWRCVHSNGFAIFQQVQ